MKVTGADDFASARKWAQPFQTQALGPKAGRTMSIILMEEFESEEEIRRKRLKAETEAVEAMADEVLHNIFLKLSERRIRAIDLFRKIDTSADGNCSASEFQDGLKWMGFDPSEKEFQALMFRLDKDGSGGVTLKEFDRAIKSVERKLVDPDKVAAAALKRGSVAAAMLKAGESSDIKCCPSCGSALQEDASFCKTCGHQLAHPRTPRKFLGYTPPHTVQIDPIDATDEFFMKVVAQMNKRKFRSLDFFRTIDRDDSGLISEDEFKIGLKKMGLTPVKEEFDNIMKRLDKDGSGDIAVKEFDRAAKLVVKKAKLQGRHGELESWARPMELPTTSTWNCSNFNTETEGSFTERSGRHGRHNAWASATLGPWATASSLMGGASINSARERFFDSASSCGHETSHKLPKMSALLRNRKPVYLAGRFEKEPSKIPHPKMLSKRDRCLTALRKVHVSVPSGGVKSFHNTPMMQSTVDQAVFNRDMDFSGDDKFDANFINMYADRAGMASWHYSKS